MPTAREDYTFPTRNYPYRYPFPDAAALAADGPAPVALAPGRLYRFVVGLDADPQPMSDADSQTLLRDPFAELLLKRGVFPMTLRSLLAALDATSTEPDGLPQQHAFLVAEGGQIAWSDATAAVNRLFRFVVVRSRGTDARLLISASTVLDSTSQFIQLMAWDASNGVYNFYERRGETWLWGGNSYHALTPGTRGRGPFDSHINGAPVMKELRQPWNNWHSMSTSIQDTVLAPDDPLRTEPLFVNRTSAHELETRVVRPGINRWSRSRLQQAIAADGARLSNVRAFFRHILETTTVNLTSSSQPSQQVTDAGTLTLPPTFFLNTTALLDTIGLDPDIQPITVAGQLYRNSLKQYAFALTDGSFRQAGDTFFAFLVPEPAFEDLTILSLLLQQRIISRRFAACLLMVDFPNPITSLRRARLMAYVPDTVQLMPASGGQPRSDLETRFVAAIEAAGQLPPDDPAQEFLAHWRLPDATWQPTFEKRIETYFSHLQAQAHTAPGFDGLVRLAESRRREFRRRPLAEFRLTIPTTNIPADAPTLVMGEDGVVREA